MQGIIVSIMAQNFYSQPAETWGPNMRVHVAVSPCHKLMGNDDRVPPKIPKLVIPKVVLKGPSNEEATYGTKLLPSDHSNRFSQTWSSMAVDSFRAFHLFSSVLGRLHSDLETFIDIASGIDVVDKKRDMLHILISQNEQITRLESICTWIPWLGEALSVMNCNMVLRETRGQVNLTLQSLKTNLHTMRNLSVPKLAVTSAVGICAEVLAHAAIPLGRLAAEPLIEIRDEDCKSAATLFIGLLRHSNMYPVIFSGDATIQVALDFETYVELRLFPNTAGHPYCSLQALISVDARLSKSLLGPISRQWLALGDANLCWLHKAISDCKFEYFKIQFREAVSPLLPLLYNLFVLDLSGHEIQLIPRNTAIYNPIKISLDSPICPNQPDTILSYQEPSAAAVHFILFAHQQARTQAIRVVVKLLRELLYQRVLPLDAQPSFSVLDALIECQLGTFQLDLIVELNNVLVQGQKIFRISLEQSMDEIVGGLKTAMCGFIYSSTLRVMRAAFPASSLSDFVPLSNSSRYACLLSSGAGNGCYFLLDISTTQQGICNISLLTATTLRPSGVTEKIYKLLSISLDDFFASRPPLFDAPLLKRVDNLIHAARLESEGFILSLEKEHLDLINAPVTFPAVSCSLEFRDNVRYIVLYLFNGERIEKPLLELHDVQSVLPAALAELRIELERDKQGIRRNP